MSVFRHTIDVAATASGPFQQVEALVDTGASYTLLPRTLLQRLGVQPVERRSFILADGRQVEYDLGEVRVRIDGRARYSVCVFGDAGATPLLGAVTLEEFGLVVDPLNESLRPAPGYLVPCIGPNPAGKERLRNSWQK